MPAMGKFDRAEFLLVLEVPSQNTFCAVFSQESAATQIKIVGVKIRFGNETSNALCATLLLTWIATIYHLASCFLE